MAPNDCGCTTPSSVPVNIPGAQGVPGQNGANGVNIETITTADFVVPAINSTVPILVANSSQYAVKQQIFASDGTNFGNFQVTALPNTNTITAKFLGNTGDSAPGVTISLGATVTAAGIQGTAGSSPATPISIANGGTNAATKGAAQTNLGLGQNALIASSSGLSQAITASFVEVGACDITVASVGEYLLMANATISMNGVTFASSRTITLKIRNITQGVDICSAAFPTEAITTTSIPSFSLCVPFILDATAVAADHYQILITIDVINSAGTLNVTAGSICAIPLRLS